MAAGGGKEAANDDNDDGWWSVLCTPTRGKKKGDGGGCPDDTRSVVSSLLNCILNRLQQLMSERDFIVQSAHITYFASIQSAICKFSSHYRCLHTHV